MTTNTDVRIRTCLFTNLPAPYRLPVFEQMGQTLDLKVYFSRGQADDRFWPVAMSAQPSDFQILSHRRLGPLVANPDLAALLDAHSYDVYVIGENLLTLPSMLIMLRAAKRRGRPVLIWSEGVDSSYTHGSWLGNWIRRQIYRRADAFLAYSSKTEDFLRLRGAHLNRIVRGAQVVPAEQLPEPIHSRSQLGLQGKRVVLYVGYFNERKGLPDLIDAFQAVATDNDCLALVGDGPSRAVLLAQAEKDPRILFPGYLDGADKTSWYAAADLFVLPTYHDPWGLVVNEAMAFGLPIIATDAAASAHDLIDGTNGFMIPSGQPAVLAEKIDQLLHSPQMCSEMGQRSKAIIQHYTVDTASRRFIKAIELANS
jgi:glycosyltransferase involved in cell wall biosynthesis